MKTFCLLIMLLVAGQLFSQQPERSKKSTRENKYKSEADSVRKKHLTPHNNSDTVQKLQGEHMPNAAPDTSKVSPMPVIKDENKHPMPVKHLPDSAKK